MKCVALQKIKWENTETTNISQTTIFNEKYKYFQRLGMDFAIHESIIHTVEGFRDINPRIKTNPKNRSF